MASKLTNCPLCSRELQEEADYSSNGFWIINCSSCGKYTMTEELVHDVDTISVQRRSLLSGYTREKYEYSNFAKLTTTNIESILDSFLIPRTPLEKINKLILYFGRKSSVPGTATGLDHGRDYTLAYAINQKELEYFLNYLQKEGFTEGASTLTITGWKRFEELQQRHPDTRQVFVAMSFDGSLDVIYKNGIRPALIDLKYNPIRMDEIEHTEDIDDRMIVEIKKSKFIVADFTLHNKGVYFESGFAMGLGIPVIRTCKEDEIKKSHFDTRQYNHILWKDHSGLYKKLKDRVEAIIE